MPTCALCESTQAVGDACDVCGRPFPASEAVPARIPRLADLEPTLFDPADAAAVGAMPELEPTSAPAAGEAAVAGQAVEGFSPTAAEPVLVVVEPLEVERSGEAQLPDEPVEARGVRCRYCLTPAEAGQRLCARCGMRLPLGRTPRAEGDAAARPCSDCGIPMTGHQCPACGARRA